MILLTFRLIPINYSITRSSCTPFLKHTSIDRTFFVEVYQAYKAFFNAFCLSLFNRIIFIMVFLFLVFYLFFPSCFIPRVMFWWFLEFYISLARVWSHFFFVAFYLESWREKKRKSTFY